ncbi:hypothetical protein BGX27_006630, partial [Mortierella sp. AM989]
ELIRQELTAVPMVAFTLDGWSSPFKSSCLVITRHWVDDNWALQDITLGFENLKDSHTGEVLAEVFVRPIERFNLQQKVLSIT